MKNNTQGKILNILIDKYTKNVERYTHNGSTWLIFTEEKKWVIELTKEGTLWYNYYFFQNIMKLLSLDVVENQHYITKWVEDTVINAVKQTKRGYEGSRKLRTKDTIQNGVKRTDACQIGISNSVVDAIQNGVKQTQWGTNQRKNPIEDTIQNGVKETYHGIRHQISEVEYTIQNGVKETKHNPFEDGLAMEEVIQNGVKYTGDRQGNYNLVVEDTIQNGVKDTHLGGKDRKIGEIKDIIENGVKVTYSDKIPHEYDWSNQFTEEIDDIIQNGIKETESIVSHRTWKSEEVIQNGIKNTDFLGPGRPEMVEKVIENGIKETKLGSPDNRDYFIEEAIQNGVKYTEYGDWEDGDERLDDIIQNGIKETTPGGYLGFVEMKGKKIHQFETAKQLYYVEDVIESGIKKTEGGVLFDESKIDTVISEGIKETNPHFLHIMNPMNFEPEIKEMKRMNEVNIVLEKGIKEVQPLPAQDGNMDWGNYYHRQEDRTKPHTQYVNDVITNGIKNKLTYDIDNVIVDVNK